MKKHFNSFNHIIIFSTLIIASSYLSHAYCDHIDLKNINQPNEKVVQEAEQFIADLKQEHIATKDKVDDSVKEIIDQNTAALQPQQIDLNELMQGPSCSEKICAPQKIDSEFTKDNKSNSTSQILIFVSLSMPDVALKAYSEAAAKIVGRLILRGLHQGSFKATQQKIMQLGINADIDPPLFEQYDIKEVPTIIHASIQNTEYSSNYYDQLKGNITLDAALELFAQKGEIKGAGILLKRLRS